MTGRPPLPPYDLEGALAKVQAAGDAWNTRDPERVAGAYTVASNAPPVTALAIADALTAVAQLWRPR